jgi:hypothetical protein
MDSTKSQRYLYSYLTPNDTVEYKLHTGGFHRCDGPALTRYERWAWFLYDQHHRYYGPQHSHYPNWMIHGKRVK